MRVDFAKQFHATGQIRAACATWDVEVELAESPYAPPAPPLWVSAFFGATGYHFLTLPKGWYGDWHPVPRRQLFLVLEGECETEVSDGTSRRGGPGTIAIHDDTWGKGHRSWAVKS